MSDWAIHYVGIPYALHGRERPALDCWGLVRLVMREQAGIELPMWDGLDYRNASETSRTIVEESMGEEWRQVDRAQAQAFDIAVMRGLWKGEDGRRYSGTIHCGIVASGARILHVERDSDTVCIPIRRIERRITGIYRHWSRVT